MPNMVRSNVYRKITPIKYYILYVYMYTYVYLYVYTVCVYVFQEIKHLHSQLCLLTHGILIHYGAKSNTSGGQIQKQHL